VGVGGEARSPEDTEHDHHGNGLAGAGTKAASDETRELHLDAADARQVPAALGGGHFAPAPVDEERLLCKLDVVRACARAVLSAPPGYVAGERGVAERHRG